MTATQFGITQYNDKVVRQFALMTVVWGVVGMLVGVIIAAQLLLPELNFDLPWLTYSRLRPLHTNAVIFAFGGSAIFATSYYIVQRTCHTRLFSDRLAAFTFWGWQTIIVLAAISLPMGLSGEGLPVGMQLVVPGFQEGRALRLAKGLESARGGPILCPLTSQMV